MLKIQATQIDGEPLQLSIQESYAPDIDEIWPEFRCSHDAVAVKVANATLSTAKKIVVLESDIGLGRTITVWATNVTGLVFNEVSNQDITVLVDDVEFDPWTQHEAYEV